MSTAVERYNPGPPTRLTKDDISIIKGSDLIPKAFRNKPADIYAAVLTGRALGIDDMHALRGIYVVDGKATIGAELMNFLVRRAGHSITKKAGADWCEVTGVRVDNGDTMSVKWSLEMATKAGLLGKDNWKKYPAAMLWARALSDLCRELFPDAITGMSYTPDEAELTAEERVSEAIGDVRVPTDDAGPDDTPAGKREDGGGPEASAAGQQAAAGETPSSSAAAPGFARVLAGSDIVDADWEPAEDDSLGEGDVSRGEAVSAGAQAETVGGPDDQAVGTESPVPQPHTEDTGQGSIFAQMAEEAISRREAAIVEHDER